MDGWMGVVGVPIPPPPHSPSCSSRFTEMEDVGVSWSLVWMSIATMRWLLACHLQAPPVCIEVHYYTLSLPHRC